MLYWVIYDISENKIRSKIASKCKDYGLKRVQKSTFLGDISKNKMDMFAIEIREILKNNKNLVYIIPSCKSCFRDKIIEGEFDMKTIKEKDFIIIGE
ncbi:MAG: CRISPR-associated endonuclease Cas2 [Candidatus Nanoarchaeia archaeon]